jgi:putative SOS response-associated peptidase YedK
MCGRFSIAKTPGAVAKAFGTVDAIPNFGPFYNAAPTQRLPVVRMGPDGERRLVLLEWGLVPRWTRDRAALLKRTGPMINARGESVAEKPSFKRPFAEQRCLVPVDGWYEWQGATRPKQPWRLAIGGGALAALAGIWESWIEPGSHEIVETFAIITTVPNPLAATIHDRMPVVLPWDRHESWLGNTPIRDLQAMLVPYAGDDLAAHKVDAAALADRRDRNRPDCIAPIASSASSLVPSQFQRPV